MQVWLISCAGSQVGAKVLYYVFLLYFVYIKRVVFNSFGKITKFIKSLSHHAVVSGPSFIFWNLSKLLYRFFIFVFSMKNICYFKLAIILQTWLCFSKLECLVKISALYQTDKLCITCSCCLIAIVNFEYLIS